MKRKIALIAVCLLAIATAGFAYANTEYIALAQDTVRSGGYISFPVDVSAIDDEDYSLVLSIAPDVDSISVKQNVNAVVNGSMVTVSSANLEDIDTLDFKVYPGEVTDETEYEITAELLTESGITKLDTAKFKAVLAEDDNSKDMDDREDRTDASVNDENEKTSQRQRPAKGRQGPHRRQMKL